MVHAKETGHAAPLLHTGAQRGLLHPRRLGFSSWQLVPEHVVMTKEEVTELLAR